MTGNKISLDTSVAVKLLNDLQFATEFLASFETVSISAVAVGELLYGAHNSARHIANVPRFQHFIDDCHLIPINREVAERYATLRLQLKKKGFPMPDSDIWIAAAAICQNLPLATHDKHFPHIDDLVVVTP
ncbi:MAG TPA: PIN domain-containing protein [Phycisphaerae bacterium]|nr:PIN domain-containing protein [Phycisphaerae bacterium]